MKNSFLISALAIAFSITTNSTYAKDKQHAPDATSSTGESVPITTSEDGLIDSNALKTTPASLAPIAKPVSQMVMKGEFYDADKIVTPVGDLDVHPVTLSHSQEPSANVKDVPSSEALQGTSKLLKTVLVHSNKSSYNVPIKVKLLTELDSAVGKGCRLSITGYSVANTEKKRILGANTRANNAKQNLAKFGIPINVIDVNVIDTYKTQDHIAGIKIDIVKMN